MKMKQKALGVLTLFAALFFSACGEIQQPVDSSNTQKMKEETAAAKSSSQDEDAAGINEEENTAPLPQGAQEPAQKIQSMEPFDRMIFNTHRAAWEADHPDAYNFSQTHKRSRIAVYTSAYTTVVDDVPSTVVYPFSVPGAPEHAWYPMFLCNTVSELYEKIDTAWTEQRYTGALFLIKYDEQRHYPAAIQIKNIDDSGYDYLAEAVVQAFDKDRIDGGKGLWKRPVEPEEIRMEPFDAAIFNTHRAAWEGDHPGWYRFHQEHDGPQAIYLYAVTDVVNDIPESIVLPGKDRQDPWLRCSSISELYEKLYMLWTEQSNTNALFLIEYNEQRHYPKYIQIKNINDSGYDYTIRFGVIYEGDMIEFEV
ncbi:MAG: hypothetical protein LBU18_03985 [Treponema sp.]|nr:hypothetical protein [Treponema sp.]